MAARRLLATMLAILVLSSLLAALVRIEPPAEETTSSSTTAPTGADSARQPEPRILTRTLRADARRAPTIRLRVGDALSLQIVVDSPAQVELPSFGELASADRFAPASFDLAPLEPGASEIRIAETGRTIGRIEVRREPTAAQGPAAASEETPLSGSGRTSGRSAGTSRSR